MQTLTFSYDGQRHRLAAAIEVPAGTSDTIIVRLPPGAKTSLFAKLEGAGALGSIDGTLSTRALLQAFAAGEDVALSRFVLHTFEPAPCTFTDAVDAPMEALIIDITAAADAPATLFLEALQ